MTHSWPSNVDWLSSYNDNPSVATWRRWSLNKQQTCAKPENSPTPTPQSNSIRTFRTRVLSAAIRRTFPVLLMQSEEHWRRPEEYLVWAESSRRVFVGVTVVAAHWKRIRRKPFFRENSLSHRDCFHLIFHYTSPTAFPLHRGVRWGALGMRVG